MIECNHEYPITACFDCGTRLDESQLQSQLTALTARVQHLESALIQIRDWTGNDYVMRQIAKDALSDEEPGI